ncbi:hypothetical protein CASFOL_037792 [Castilleja foliolosa]|uniref:Uncharacterized protein n=1 Tax=Castilleja foliolosa TaxID=1961234 RepID=A0ABD3BKB1_9LAMI
MEVVNGIPANAQQNGGIRPEIKPEFGPSTLNIKVNHGSNEHEVAVPSNFTFGDLKSIIVQKIGLNLETHKLLFRGKEKEDDEYLQTAGVKDNSKLILMEDTTIGQKKPEEVMETSVISRGSEAVAQVREEVDKLADKVSAVQAVVESGTKVNNKDILYLTEMLMRQLLKLDGIDAEGEGKVQRKMEVRRVQSFVDTMDIIKSRNSNPSNDAASVTTQWETFEPSCGTVPSPAPSPAHAPNPSSYLSPTPLPSHAPAPTPFPAHTPVPSPFPAHTPNPSSYSSPTPLLFHSPDPTLFPAHAPNPSSYSSPTPLLFLSPDPTLFPAHAPNPSSYSSPIPLPTHVPTPTPTPFSANDPNPSSYSSPTPLLFRSTDPTLFPTHAPNPSSYSSPTPLPTHVPIPTPNPISPNPTSFPSPTHVRAPAPVSSLATSPTPSSPKVTQDWEHFD